MPKGVVDIASKRFAVKEGNSERAGWLFDLHFPTYWVVMTKASSPDLRKSSLKHGQLVLVMKVTFVLIGIILS